MAKVFSQRMEYKFNHFPEVFEYTKDKHHRCTYITKDYQEFVPFGVLIPGGLYQVVSVALIAFVFYNDIDAVEFALKFGDWFEFECESDELVMSPPTEEEMEIIKWLMENPN